MTKFIKTSTTQNMLLNYYKSENSIKRVRLQSILQELLEFELNEWQPIPFSRYSSTVSKIPLQDAPSLLDLFRQTFTWKEEISVLTDLVVKGSHIHALHCKNRDDFYQKISCNDLHADIYFSSPNDIDESGTFIDPLRLDLESSIADAYAPHVIVRELRVKE